MSSQDPIEDLLPLVLSEHEDELWRAAEDLLRTGQARLDTPTGHVQALLQDRTIFHAAALITVVSKNNRQVSRSWTRLSPQSPAETAESIVKYLAGALIYAIYDEATLDGRWEQQG